MSNGALAALQQAQEAHDRATATTVPGIAGQPWTPELVTTLALTTLGFTLLVILIAGALLWRVHASPAHVLRATGILSIVGLATLLLVVGYGNEQLTPIVGLFGAIAGYLLGRDTRLPDAGAEGEGPRQAAPAGAVPQEGERRGP